ncbi:TetR family transcriptional regulator [Nocardia yamanashiensis]|uniref:TetR family transcriptional regulator n=1 Tax=Nocardia yamanashiensis TaxID=209247 RepID=UPI000833E109|nr:TetR family transcriptional regulator [Nocardia yamanashiensis]
MTDDSRARILATALALFAERGFHAVSVREIATQVGLTKTAVLYHFPSKTDIVAALVEPLLTDSEALLETVRDLPDADARRWGLVTGLLDVWLAHGQLLRMHMHDQALSEDSATYLRLRDFALAAQDLIAGPGADFTARVRAAQVYAALSDPITIFADHPPAQLRAAVLDGVQRILGSAAPDRSHHRPPATNPQITPPGRGRPAAVTATMAESARRMRDSGEYTMAEIATELGVSRATLYRHLTEPNE